MDSSRPLAAPANRARALLFGLFLLAGGCAHASAAASAARPAGAPTSRPASSPASAASAAPSGARDPSEEITPEELASIPDPVPAGNDSSPPPVAPAKAPAGALEPRSAPPESIAPGPPAIAAPPGEFTWRVQILATPDRALAARVAAEAAERLGTTSMIVVESGLSKVRLGGFATEGEAQILKGRAVEMGYPGAFRVKVRTRASDE